jgi:hypothetical protein
MVVQQNPKSAAFHQKQVRMKQLFVVVKLAVD